MIERMQINEDFKKQMFISFFKTKLETAKENLKKANDVLNEAIKYGSGDDIWIKARNAVRAEENFKFINMCYIQVSKGE